MAKRRYSIDENTIEKRLDEGRGGGQGKGYTPWMYVHEVPSSGYSSIRIGWKAGREHHLLSKLEAKFFYICEWDDDVLDFREQFPLPRHETRQIAKELGVRHPRDPKTKTDIVITTDALLTVTKNVSSKTVARTVKYDKDLSNERTKEKLLIEKTFWQRRDVEWGIITENSINEDLYRNVEWVHKSHNLLGAFPSLHLEQIQCLENELLAHLPIWKGRLSILTDHLDSRLNLPIGCSLSMVQHLIAKKKVITNMHERINPCSVIEFTLPLAKEIGQYEKII